MEKEKSNNQEQKPYTIMESMDDKQIVAETGGYISDTWVYSFMQGGKEVTGLSYTGVKEAVRHLNQKNLTSIRVSGQVAPKVERVSEGHPLYVEGLGDGFVAHVYAEDVKNGGGMWGSKFEAIMSIRRDGSKYLNQFAYEQAISKAQRNALRALIPEDLFSKMVNEFLKKGKGAKYTEAEARDTLDIQSNVVKDLEEMIQAKRSMRTLIELGEKIGKLKANKKLSEKELLYLQKIYKLQIDKINSGKIKPINNVKNNAKKSNSKPAKIGKKNNKK